MSCETKIHLNEKRKFCTGSTLFVEYSSKFLFFKSYGELYIATLCHYNAKSPAFYIEITVNINERRKLYWYIMTIVFSLKLYSDRAEAKILFLMFAVYSLISFACYWPQLSCGQGNILHVSVCPQGVSDLVEGVSDLGECLTGGVSDLGECLTWGCLTWGVSDLGGV